MTILNTTFRKVAFHAATVATVGLLSAAAPAQATTLAFESFAQGYQIATIANAAPATGGTYGAGQLKFNMVDNGVVSTLLAYCVDIFQEATSSAEEYALVDGITHFGAERADDLGRLFTQFDALNGNTEVTAQETGAMQIAIWEIVNEVATANGALHFDLSSGGFTATSPNADTITLAQGWLNMLPGSANSYSVSVYENASYQDYLVLNKVPEPGSLALMFGGLGALGFLSRRRQAAAIAA